jgi:LCP family protein required for cell wall assembly
MDGPGEEPRGNRSFIGFADDEQDADDARAPGAEQPPRGRGRRVRKGGFLRRHKALTVLLVILGLVVVLVAGVAFYLNREIGNIPRIALNIPDQNRPAEPSGRYAGSMNILLAGADNGDSGGPTIADTVRSGKWNPGSHRSDTIMVLHITADRKHAYLISVPRDTYTNIDGYGMQKINAAFSFGGPSLYVQTLEQFTGLRMKHLAIIDWNGFRDLSTALGGVRVYVSQDSYDSVSGLTWHKGWTTVSGDRALRYVRQRHGLPNGDFDRIQRQQNFLRSVLTQLASRGTLTSPLTFKNALHAMVSHLTVDDQLGNGEIRSLGWSLRNLRPKDITFLTTPMKRFDNTTPAGDVIIPDLSKTRELFGDVATDDLAEYVKKYGGAGSLNAPTNVR